MNRLGSSRGLWSVVVLLVLGGLAPSTTEAQEWHELYADGLTALQNGQGQRAVELLERAELSPRTFWTFAREFSPFKAARGGWWTATQIPDTILPVHSYDHAVRCSRQSPPDAHPRGSP